MTRRAHILPHHTKLLRLYLPRALLLPRQARISFPIPHHDMLLETQHRLEPRVANTVLTWMFAPSSIVCHLFVSTASVSYRVFASNRDMSIKSRLRYSMRLSWRTTFT